jgi:uncharacterized protein (TIGR04255 family)
MNPDDFPFQIPDRLPERIDPCPIVEAVLEIRFVTAESWSVLPGLLYSRIRERYPEKIELPISQIPEEVRRRDPAFTYLPLVQFLGKDFLIQFGPRVVSLVTKPNAYSGWSAIRAELQWLVEQIQAASFIAEGERLGVRYIDFFKGNVFPHLLIGGQVFEKPLRTSELSLAAVFRRAPFTARLNVTNGAVVTQGEQSRVGSIFDLDVWAGSLDFDLFTDGIQRFDEAHALVKGIFFSLLKPEFLTTLHPTYS